jgi:kumamolisin
VLIDPATQRRTILTASERARDAKTAKLAPLDPGDHLSVTVRLRPGVPLPDSVGSEDRATFEREHGAQPDDIAKVDRFAHDYGLHVDRTNAAERSVVLSGTASQMHDAFGVDLAHFRKNDRTFVGHDGALSVPTSISDAVTGVFGLDDTRASHPHIVVAPDAASAHGYTPLDVAKAYDFPAGDGKGQHVAVISLGGRYDDKVQAHYLKALGVAHTPFNVVKIDGGADDPSDPGPTGENMLDAEVIGSLAPQADKTMYIAPNTDRGFVDAVSRALHDGHHNTTLSISWGAPEEHYTPQARAALDELFHEAKAMGVNVFCASGDNGSADAIPDDRAHTDFPSASQWTIATGGTKLQLAHDGTIARETVWNELKNGEGATGGGISTTEPKPADQHALAISGRGEPDIAGNADPTTGYLVLEPRGDGGASPAIVGGTSAVAPLYASLAARIGAAHGGPVDLRKAIYAAPARDFHDITQGNNGAYAAGPGWDAASGRGSIDGNAFLTDLH